MTDSQNEKTNDEASFIERLGRRVGMTAHAGQIYGEPVERDGVTVIPVAKAVYGFGGGSGKKEKDEGSGGGGGVALTPVGYIEIKNGETRFRATRDWASLIPGLAVLAPVFLFTAWGLTRLLGPKKGDRKTEMRRPE